MSDDVCACCDGVPTTTAWEVPLCAADFAEWLAYPNLTAGAVDPELETGKAMTLAQLCDAYRDKTRRWAAWWRKKRTEAV